MSRFIISLLILFSSFGLFGQQYCGTITDQSRPINSEMFSKFLKERNLKSNQNELDSVGVTFHVVVSGANPLEITTETLIGEIEFSNRYYAQAGIKFFNCGSPRFIEGQESYNPVQGDNLNRSNYVPNTINVYYVDEVTTNSGDGLCGYAQFPWVANPSNRYIVMSKSPGCLIRGTTLAHELGHFYGLLHTHDSFMGLEFVNGSNCMTAGDGLCDTPADPNLGNGYVANNCTYDGTVVDPLGQPYAPSVANIMSYAPSQCVNRFSPEQAALINFYHSTDNDYILSECNFFPDFAVSTSTQLATRQSGESINISYEFSNLGLQDNYEVPIYIYLSEDENNRGMIIQKDTIQILETDEINIEDLAINFPLNRSTGTYYLTILIDPEFEVLELSESNNLFTTVIEIDNSALADELIYPNPTTNSLRLFLRASRLTQDMDIYIYNVHGQIMKQINAFKNQDEYFTEIDVSELQQGVYFMEVFFEKQTTSKSFKFIKQ